MQPLSSDDPVQIGQYRLRSLLGVGGMGRVYLAATPAGRPLALKVVRPELTHDQEFRARFRQEIQAARRVRGLYTAELVDADPDADPPWLATAYVAGPSLKEYVDENGPLSEGEAFRLIAGVAEALQAIHAANVVHRDLKPSNVVLGPDGPRVIDFGIARALEVDATALTSTGESVGSPQFMAPEQLLDHPVTPMIDVFALGSVAAYAVLGRAPFGRGMPNAVFYRVIHEAPDLNGCPPRLLTLIERCLAKQAADRPQLGQILRFCLENADAGADSTPTQPAAYRQSAPMTRQPHGTATAVQVDPLPPPAATGPGRRHRRPANRRPRRAVLLATGALAVAAAAAVTVYALPGSPSSASSSGPAPAARWPLTSADGTTVSDATGKYPATATNVHWSAGSPGAAFDGSDSEVAAAGPVLNTAPGASFTVAAWVYLTKAVTFSATAVSQDNQDGNKNSGFYLQYAGQANQSWSFTRSSVNTPAAVGIDALSSSPAALNTWVHLVGVYDATDDQLRLYVNGVPQGTATDTTPYLANGSLVIGRAEFGGTDVDWFPGYIRDVEVFQQALTPAEVKAL
jgi:Protein kinase domain/Concanavalin A-like lectin/glucanases superfamily